MTSRQQRIQPDSPATGATVLRVPWSAARPMAMSVSGPRPVMAIPLCVLTMVPRMWLAVLVVVLLLAGPAWAHSIRMFVTEEGPDAWSGRVFLPGGGKPAGATVRLLAADGSQRAEMETDADGAFRYEGKLPAGEYTFRVELDAGHRAEWPIEVGAADSIASGDPSDGDTQSAASAAQPTAARSLPDDLDARISRAVAKEVAPLRQELAEYRAAVRTGDILAGMGAIALLAGAGFYLLARRERQKAEG